MVTSTSRTELPGSHRELATDPRHGPADASSVVTVTVMLPAGGPLPAATERLNHQQLAERVRPSDQHVEAVRTMGARYGLQVGDLEPGRTRMTLTGTIEALSRAFGTELHLHVHSSGSHYRARGGTLSVDADLAPAFAGVFGLDTRPQASTQFRVGSAQAVSYPPTEVAAAYGYPTSGAAGQTVGLIELGGGFKTADIQTYFQGLGLPVPTVTAVSVDGGTNSPTNAQGADGEVMLDIEMVGAVASGADIAVYFAPNTDQGFLDAITQAANDTTNKPSVISISWGGPESSWTASAMQQMSAAIQTAGSLGVTVVTAAGDNGSADQQGGSGVAVDFPSSSPYSLACGGTTLDLSGAATDPTITSEVVWNETAAGDGATGGGVSVQFPLPTYQESIGVPPVSGGTATGRGVPDVAGDADPETGYQVRVDGSDMVIGGTSAVAPLWAGLVALCNATTGKAAGFINPTLYTLGKTPPAGGAVFNDITSGNNGAYSAGTGWDACSGWGSPRAAALLAAVQAQDGTGGA